MPDITMCNPINCGVKKGCYRFKATPNEYRQAYCDFSITNDGQLCTSFLALLSTEVKKLKKEKNKIESSKEKRKIT